MSCEHWSEPISAKVDGELDPAESARVEQHLAECAGCRAWAAEAEDLRRRMLIRVPVDSSGSGEIVDRCAPAAPRWRPARVASVAAAVVLLAGLAWAVARDQPSGSGVEFASTRTVEATEGAFTSEELTVSVGEKVRWVNESGVEHNLVRDVGTATIEGELRPGSAEWATFEDEGSYDFHCTLHPSMSGTVRVQS